MGDRPPDVLITSPVAFLVTEHESFTKHLRQMRILSLCVGTGSGSGVPLFGIGNPRVCHALRGDVREERMVVSGEIIRLMNYVDDISTTLRRITATIPLMTDEEKKRLAEYMRKADPSVDDVIQILEGKSK